MTESSAMAQLDPQAIQRVMRRNNFMFKHQLANHVGISYNRLTEILVNGETKVEEEIVTRLCNGLGCQRVEIVIDE